MSSFSQRYGYSAVNGIQKETMDSTLKNRLWNSFYAHEFDPYDSLEFDLTNVEKMMNEMGVVYNFPRNRIDKGSNAEALRKYLLGNPAWYVMYDFIEKYIRLCKEDDRKNREAEFNRILEEEVSGYRIIKGLVTPIISENELSAIEDSMDTPYQSVSVHISKALNLFSDRKKPDYENSIKESISAVEAICCIITGDNKASLGKALDKLEQCGIVIHKSLKSAMDKLYGYTSDENGIRHAGIDFKGASSEDAKYMLITCSAFVNYLIEKWEKIKTAK